jgi:hypothetical protein
MVARAGRADFPLPVPAGHRRHPGDVPLVARPEGAARNDVGRAPPGDPRRRAPAARPRGLLARSPRSHDRRASPAVLRVRGRAAPPRRPGARRGDLERAELEHLLEAAVHAQRRGCRRAGVRGPAGRVLGRAARAAPRRERDRRECSARQRRTVRLPPVALAAVVVPGSRRGLPGKRSRAADLRHGRPQPVPQQRGRTAVGDASGWIDRRRRLREARQGPDGRVPRDRPAGAGRGALDLVHGGRLSDPRRSPLRQRLRRTGERSLRARPPRPTGVAGSFSDRSRAQVASRRRTRS